MPKIDIIAEALTHKQIFERDNINVETNTNTISVNLFRIMLYILCNFVITYSLTESETNKLLKTRTDFIVDVITTELEIVLLHFNNLYKEENSKIIKLDNKEECLLVIAIQEKVNKKIEKYI